MAGIIALDGTEVTLRRTARARRMTLRVARRDGSVTLTLPPGVREAEALAFLTSRRDWLRGALATVSPTGASRKPARESASATRSRFQAR